MTAERPTDRSPDGAGGDVGADRSTRDRAPGVLAVAGLASLAAGAIQGAATGAHGEARQAAVVFTLLAVAQLAWGGLVLVRSHRLLTLAGVGVNAAAVVGWVLAESQRCPGSCRRVGTIGG